MSDLPVTGGLPDLSEDKRNKAIVCNKYFVSGDHQDDMCYLYLDVFSNEERV